MRIADIVTGSIVDGPGIRITIFTQGCHHNCKGCHNPGTHNIHGGKEVSISEIYSVIIEDPLIDGITLSGGEPFLQANDCYKLAKIAHELELDVWTYTGYTWEELLQHDEFLNLLKETDVLIDGKFEIDKKSYDLYFRGSSNQRVIDVKKSLETGEIVLYHK